MIIAIQYVGLNWLGSEKIKREQFYLANKLKFTFSRFQSIFIVQKTHVSCILKHTVF